LQESEDDRAHRRRAQRDYEEDQDRAGRDQVLSVTGPRFDEVFRETLEELFRWRRDERHFLTRPVPEEQIEELLRIAQTAPSVGNSQPWRFVRVVSPALRTALADHVDAQVERAGAIYDDRGQREAYRALKLHGLREAPEVLAVFCDEATDAGAALGTVTMPEARSYSVVLAIHTLWLAARANGIALGWVSILDAGLVAGLLGAPQPWRLIALLCIGYAEAESDTPELERRGWQGRLDWRSNVTVC
jgi:5,6-dimethylbenzimidazole synthase